MFSIKPQTVVLEYFRAPALGGFVALLCASLVALGAQPRQATANRGRKSGAASGELRIVAANVQLLLIAPDGKETGYDPRSKKKLHVIPGSAYYEDALLAYDSGRVDPNTTQTIDVRHPVAGKYQLVVSPGTAADGEAYDVRATFYSQDGSEAGSARIAGTAKQRTSATYELTIGGTPAILVIANSVRQPHSRKVTAN
jgi:hypothetical protein